MSSGFVSGGTVDAPIERNDEWLAAQKEIEANRQRKAELARQTEGKSLYETLEANKAAKQDAFEEANRLKNQFRALDEDEIEFLDSVLESTRKEEDRVKRETAEGLALFRQQQEEVDKKSRENDDGAIAEEGSPTTEGSWTTGPKKRKRKLEKDSMKGLKIRRASSSADSQIPTPSTRSATSPTKTSCAPANLDAGTASAKPNNVEESKKPPSSSTSKSGLVSYGSDEEDDW